MEAADQVTFAGAGLDRQAHRRAEARALAADPAALVVPLWQGRVLLGSAGLGWLPPGHDFLATHGGEQVFLGAAGGPPLFAREVPGWVPAGAPEADGVPGRPGADQPAEELEAAVPGARFADLRAAMAGLAPLDAEIAASARGILEWHRTHLFCAACGARSAAEPGGWQRLCPACGRRHFPRTDPVVIMLVTHGNSVLVGRSAGWPDRFYSLLAGFMEPGETVAAAVAREVAEEVGVRIGRVRMLASQPWPFPASLMLGCRAEAATTAITCDPVEIDDALWVSREEMVAVFAGRHEKIRPPRKGAIAQFLLEMWLADRLD